MEPDCQRLSRVQDNVRVIGAGYGYDAAETAALKMIIADKLAELAAKGKSHSEEDEANRAPQRKTKPKDPQEFKALR